MKVDNKVFKLVEHYGIDNLSYYYIDYNFYVDANSHHYLDSDKAVIIVHNNDDKNIAIQEIPKLELITLFSKKMSVPLVKIPKDENSEPMFIDNIKLNEVKNKDANNFFYDNATLYGMKHVIFIDYDVYNNKSKFFIENNVEDTCYDIGSIFAEKLTAKEEEKKLNDLKYAIKHLEESERVKLLAKLIQ